MKTSDFDYELPQELIAQTPVEPRDSSRLLVYHRDTGAVEHKIFRDVIDYLNPGDVLVINQTRVIPARLYGVKEGTGGAIEFLLLRRLNLTDWEVILKPGKKAKPGARFVFGNGELVAEILTISEDGGRTVRFFYEGVFEDVLDRLGQMPLPPYIHEKLEDKTRYQTVYAKVDGSAAAPTAGLHFTPELLEKSSRRASTSCPCCCTSVWAHSDPSKRKTWPTTICTANITKSRLNRRPRLTPPERAAAASSASAQRACARWKPSRRRTASCTPAAASPRFSSPPA